MGDRAAAVRVDELERLLDRVDALPEEGVDDVVPLEAAHRDDGLEAVFSQSNSAISSYRGISARVSTRSSLAEATLPLPLAQEVKRRAVEAAALRPDDRQRAEHTRGLRASTNSGR